MYLVNFLLVVHFFISAHFCKYLFLCYLLRISGDSGSRTRVQTRNQYAFYMLIPACVFVQQRWSGLPAVALSAVSHQRIAALRRPVLILLRPFILQPQDEGLERRLDEAPCTPIKRSTILRSSCESYFVVAS